MRGCREELTLDQMLSDPLIASLMHADGVDRDELAADLARVSEERSDFAEAA